MTTVRTLVRAMPGPGSDGYRAPSSEDRATMSDAIGDIEAGDLREAAGLVAPLQFRVGGYTDTATGRNLVALAEDPRADGSYPRGWGTYLFDPASRSSLVVETAHPLDDIDSWIVGVETFRAARARWLLVAGASRFAGVGDTADAAHDPDTVFYAVHRALLTPSSIVFQPHGFDTSTHSDYGDVVVSSGTFVPGPLADAVTAALRGRGLSVCEYDGEHCATLGGTTNVEGSSTREDRAQFLHVEMAARVRRDERLRMIVAQAVARAATGSAGGS